MLRVYVVIIQIVLISVSSYTMQLHKKTAYICISAKSYFARWRVKANKHGMKATKL